jgi:hypothetical protein
MPTQRLADAYLAFRNDCIWLQTIYNTFSALYQSGDIKTSEIMKATAPAFFSDLNHVLLDYFVLQVCRVTDSATSGRGSNPFSNLTVGGVNDLLKEESLFNPAIEAATKGLEPFRGLLKDARNKLVAHADLNTVLSGKVQGEHTDADREAFFSHLYRYVDEVGIALGLGPLDFRVTSSAGDSLDLIRCLKAGQHASRVRG